MTTTLRLQRSDVRTFRRSNVQRSNDGYVWALKDVSFEVRRGEVVGTLAPRCGCSAGVIGRPLRFAPWTPCGRNRTRKTTLLKILSRITEPTEGRAETFGGRVGSLLEACPERSRGVGTGFHPELTERDAERITLDGAILGIKR